MQNRSRRQRALLQSKEGGTGRGGRVSLFPDTLKRLFTLSFFFTAALCVSCAGTVAPAPVKDAVNEYYFFDGISLKKVTPVQGRISVAGEVTEGNYGVVFFTKEGCYPLVEVFRATERPFETEVRALTTLPDPGRGTLIGVVYKSVSGGKIRPRRGIVSLYKGEVVRIAGRNRSYTVLTDAQGVYRLLVPAGEYTVSLEHGEPSEVIVEPGKTVIHPIRRGVMLVD